MSRPSLEALLAELTFVENALTRGRASGSYAAAICMAAWDLKVAARLLREAGCPAQPAPTIDWLPPVAILARRLMAVRAGLERELVGRDGIWDREDAAVGPALQSVSKAVAQLLISGAMLGELSGACRSMQLHAIADQLQTSLDLIDAIVDRATEVAVASCHVQGAIDRLRIQAGSAPVDARAGSAL